MNLFGKTGNLTRSKLQMGLPGIYMEVILKGGLGNQLFQYATARSLCIKKKIPYLLFNTDSYHNESLNREFSLEHLKIKGRALRRDVSKKLFRKNTKLNKLATFFLLHKRISETEFTIQDFSREIGFLATLDGFWQSASYFNDIRDILLEEITPKKIPALPRWTRQPNTVAVHVRRTDYLHEKRYAFLGKKYYDDSIEILRHKLDKPSLIFFSDDIEWCKNKFNGIENTIFFEDELWSKDYLQLYLMSQCKHQVIANSSFSWWGAWLNRNDDKIIIRPAKPFRDKTLEHESYYPDDWISINND